MTAITQLREEIEKHPVGSATARLLSWAELSIGDSFDRISELETEMLEQDSMYRDYSEALKTILKLANVKGGLEEAYVKRLCEHALRLK